MQSDLSQTSTQILNHSPEEDPEVASQHGFFPHSSHSADPPIPLDGTAIESSGLIGDMVNGDAELAERLRRLNVDGDLATRPKPSVQRISEYENASLPPTPKKQNEGPAFKIIKKKGHTLDGPQLETFPNGTRELPP
jgi:hypothetical protein